MATAGFLHTSVVHVPTFDALIADRAPHARSVSIVDETLLADARTAGPEAVATRVAEALTVLRDRGADIVCCTCSTIGSTAEAADVGIPVFRVDRPMARRAALTGTRIGVIAALESTIAPTRALLLDEARLGAHPVDLHPVIAQDAWARFEAGDLLGYTNAVAQTARSVAPNVDVIVLAQASMADAEDTLSDLAVPVLSSPRLAADYLAAAL